MTEALEHLRVVELCDDIQAAFCGKQFAAWGARVVTIEPPAGHRLRDAAPVIDGVSLLWEYVSGRKTPLTTDIEAPDAGTKIVRDLLDGADVLVTDWKPSRLAAAGLDYASLAARNPGLVCVHLSPFGTRGPYAEFEGTDLIAQALSGFLSFNGLPDREPVKIAANVLAYACGVSAFVGAMAALRERRLSGHGQLVESAAIEAIASIVPYLRTEYFGQSPKRNGAPAPGNDTYETADGYVYFNLGPDRAWEDFLTAMGLDASDAPPELHTREGRTDRSKLKPWVAETVKKRQSKELFLLLNTMRITTGALFTPEDLTRDEHLEARGFLHEVEHARLGRVVVPGAPGLMSATPMIGVGTAGGLKLEVGTTIPASGSNLQPPTSSPPLRGLRVLDCTAAWIGTYATMLLGDLGAEVIKVESPTRPDVWRGVDGPPRLPPSARPGAHPWNLNVNFNSVNRNKRGICLDLDSQKGKELFLRLAEKADLVMENYTPRVMDNFGLGYEALRAVNDDVIMVSFSGFGATGPYADFRAIGASTEMHAGWDSLQGYPDRPPIMLGAMFADAITGLQMGAMALVALEHRDRTGEGQNVEGSMFEAAVAYIGEELMRASLRPGETSRRVNRHPDMAPHGVFPCAGEDRWIAIAVRDDSEWQRLVKVAGGGFEEDGAQGSKPVGAQRAAPLRRRESSSMPGRHALNSPEYATAAGRLANIDALERDLAAWTRHQDGHDLMRRLQVAGVPAGVVQNTAEVLADEHFAATGWFIPMTHPDLGTHRQNGFPWRFSRSTLVAKTSSPRLGEHSREVLAGELGLSADEIEALFAEGVTGEVLEKEPEDQAAG